MRSLGKLRRYALVMALPGCNLFSSGREVALRTNATAYVATPVGLPTLPHREFTVVVSTQNYSRQPVFLENCMPSSRQPIYWVSLADRHRPEDDAGYGPAWACVGHDQQLEIGPLETRVDTILLAGPTSRNGQTGEWLGIMEGRFRIAFEVRSCRGSSCSSEWVKSNIFSVAQLQVR